MIDVGIHRSHESNPIRVDAQIAGDRVVEFSIKHRLRGLQEVVRIKNPTLVAAVVRASAL